MRPLRDIGQRTALGLAGVIFLLVGLAFLTVAAWMVLVALMSVEAAALVLGSVFVGSGCLAWAFALRRTPALEQTAPPPKAGDLSPMATIVAAFVDGMAKGYQTGKSRQAP